MDGTAKMKYAGRAKTNMSQGSSYGITGQRLSINNFPKGSEPDIRIRKPNNGIIGCDTPMRKATGNYPITPPKNNQKWQETTGLTNLLIVDLECQDPAGGGHAGLLR